MRTYTNEQWLQLGRVVSRYRRSAGLSDSKAWASKVQRSTRVLLGLERGEAVGVGTLEAVERALGWYPGSTFEILEGVDPAKAISPNVGGSPQDAVKGYVDAPGPRVDGGVSDSAVLDAINEMRQDMRDVRREFGELRAYVSERLDRRDEQGS